MRMEDRRTEKVSLPYDTIMERNTGQSKLRSKERQILEEDGTGQAWPSLW
jgi:hypothetical protein